MAAPGRCPSTEELAAFTSGVLPARQQHDVQQHLDGCVDCFATAARLMSPPRDVSPLALDATVPLDAGPTAPPLARGMTLSRYTIVERLGGGGMGDVYVAYDAELDRKLAVKLLRADGAKAHANPRGRLMREAQAMARLSHPNVVAVYDVGAVGERVFVAMELVDGMTLTRWIDVHRPSWRKVIELFVQAARGLHAAHVAGLVHRDFKPDNVMVGRDERVRVLDFGLARASEEPIAEPGTPPPSLAPATALTPSGALVGTPLYMAPEQWRNQPADARSDQFSFCVALFEALWGMRPFAGETAAQLAASVQRGVVLVPPAERDVPRWVEDVVLRGLRVDRVDRFPSLAALIAALEAGPPPPLRRRHARPWWPAGIGVTVAALAVGLAAQRRSTGAARLAHANALVVLAQQQSDPTLAAAWVREVPPTLASRAAIQTAEEALAEPESDAIVGARPHDVLAVALSADGKHIVTGSRDRTARVWDADGGEPRVLRHPGAVTAVAFAPDGARVATGCDDGSARLWRADGGGEPLVVRGHAAAITSIAWSRDGRRIATGSRDGSARVWSADGSGPPLVLRAGAAVLSLAFSPDGAWLAAGAEDKRVRVWQLDGTAVARPPVVLRGARRPVGAVAFSTDGRSVLGAASADGVRIWSRDGVGPPEVHPLRRAFTSLVFSPDRTRILLGLSQQKSAELWALDGAVPLVLRGHSDEVRAVAFSGDGQRVVTGSRDCTARLWRLDHAGGNLALRGHAAALTQVSASDDGSELVSASLDGTVRAWSADGTSPRTLLRAESSEIAAAATTRDGAKYVTALADGTLQVWNRGASAPVVLRGPGEPILAVAFDRDGRRVVAGARDATARVWSADGSGAPVVLAGHSEAVAAVAFSPDGRRVATGSEDGVVRLFDAGGGGRPLELRGHAGGVTALAFSSEGAWIVSGSSDTTARVWRSDGSGEPVVLRGHGGPVVAVAFDRAGRRVVTAAAANAVRVWSADGVGEPVIWRGDALDASAVAFSADGDAVLIGSADDALRVWNLEPLMALWTQSRYCVPAEERMRALGIDRAEALAAVTACRQTVVACSAGRDACQKAARGVWAAR